MALVLYVIILSAALDLVPPSTPKGIIAFCNIFPAIVATLGWSYFLKGNIQYAQRIVGCALLSFIGMLVSVFYDMGDDVLLTIPRSLPYMRVCLRGYWASLSPLSLLVYRFSHSPE